MRITSCCGFRNVFPSPSTLQNINLDFAVSGLIKPTIPDIRLAIAYTDGATTLFVGASSVRAVQKMSIVLHVFIPFLVDGAIV